MKALVFKSKLLPCAVAGVLLALSSTVSWAACTLTGPAVTVTITVPATLRVPKNVPNGTELFRSTNVRLTGSPSFTCGADKWGYQNSMGETSDDGPSPIGTTGLGWRWIYNDGLLKPYQNGNHLTAGTYNNSPTQNGIRIYKIGDVSPGTVPVSTLGSMVAGGSPIASLRMSNTLAFTEISCETPSVNVNLGKQRSSQFGGVGTAIGEKAFNIQLKNCPAGLSGISYRLDPVNTAFDAKNGILALDPGGATGVGIQITDDNSAPVSLGQAHKFLSSAPTGNYAIPLKAAYYKTSNTVVGGIANASMQFTITYQ